jgi:diacylglycerol kinase family enzyme
MRRRAAAAVAALLAAAAVALAILALVDGFPRGLAVVACTVAGVIAAWHAVIRRGRARAVRLALAVLLLVGATVLIVTGDHVLEGALVLATMLLALAAARTAFAVHATLPAASPPREAVLFWNPRSGGGKATRFRLADEARARGIEPVELGPGDDLETLVADSVAHGADALAAAGGDGTQAIVARLAAQHDLPYACIPAGTRNHFALDLGVDRDDVVGALDAFVDGGERRVDLAEVNGRVFVNNVSLGLYADAVQQSGYREAKLHTLLNTLPEVLGPEDGVGLDLHWSRPDGTEEAPAPAILVSNNPYRLGRAIASGTRPRVDLGELGIAVFDAPHAAARPWHAWAAPSFEVASEHPVHAGIDGEAATLAPPLRFVSRPGVLRVRIARSHPGASPSAELPDTALETWRALIRIALGRDAGTGASSRP